MPHAKPIGPSDTKGQKMPQSCRQSGIALTIGDDAPSTFSTIPSLCNPPGTNLATLGELSARNEGHTCRRSGGPVYICTHLSPSLSPESRYVGQLKRVYRLDTPPSRYTITYYGDCSPFISDRVSIPSWKSWLSTTPAVQNLRIPM